MRKDKSHDAPAADGKSTFIPGASGGRQAHRKARNTPLEEEKRADVGHVSLR